MSDVNSSTLREVTETTRSLVEMMRANGLTELDVETGSVSIHLRMPKSGGTGKGHAVKVSPKTTHEPIVAERGGHLVTAPMIGTYYASPSPAEPPFVRIGDHIQAGQPIGIIEAMKIMNEIVADRTGVVVEILVANAQAVEYGSPLLRLELNGDNEE